MRVRMSFKQDPSSACGGFRMTTGGFLPILQQPVERGSRSVSKLLINWTPRRNDKMIRKNLKNEH